MTVLSFSIDQKTRNLMNELKSEFHAVSDADLLRRVLGLTKLAAEKAGKDGLVEIRAANSSIGIMLDLRN